LETYVSIPNQTQPKATKMNPLSSSIRYIAIKYLMSETTDENLLRQLTVGQYTYCDSLWSKRWTRSKQKTLNDWLEYMEKCVEMANSENVSWDKPSAILHIDEDGQETLYRKEDFFDDGHYQTDTNEENVEMINDWTDEHIPGEDETDDDDTTGEELFVQMVAEMVGGQDDGNWVEPTEFEEFTYHGTTFWKNTDGKCQWFYEYNNGEVGDELGIYSSDTELEFSDGEGKDATDYVPVLYWAGLVGFYGDIRLIPTLHPVAKLIKRLQIRPMIATADSRAHEIIAHRAKYGNAPLFENNIVFGNFFSREQFAEECSGKASDYFDEFQEHIHELGRQGHFNELMKEYFEEWLETNQ
jgi:hypothetical protein